MDQTLINIVIAIAGSLGGFILNQLWQAVKDLQRADKELVDDVTAMKVLVAGNYVTLSTFRETTRELMNKLDNLAENQNQILQHLANKADRL